MQGKTLKTSWRSKKTEVVLNPLTHGKVMDNNPKICTHFELEQSYKHSSGYWFFSV